jgi:DNA polymerase-3 subunit delta'
MSEKGKKINSSNWGLLGHEWAVNLLRRHVIFESQRHAYLVTGPQSIGRRTLALRFAQALNCPSPTAPGEPCRNCQTCVQIEAMRHPDLAVLQSDQVGGILKVDPIRELIRSLSLAPYAARYRVAILLRFEEANPNAANALLKTLEEPPPQVLLILTAESVDRLMPTIVSRCEVIKLRPVQPGIVSRELESRWKIQEDEARNLAQLCSGRPGYALKLHQEPALLSRRRSWLEDQQRLLSANLIDRFAYAERVAKDKDKTRATLLLWQSFWRDVLLLAEGAELPLTNMDQAEEVTSLANRFGSGPAERLVKRLQELVELLDRNVNPRLIMEIFMLDLPNKLMPDPEL